MAEPQQPYTNSDFPDNSDNASFSTENNSLQTEGQDNNTETETEKTTKEYCSANPPINVNVNLERDNDDRPIIEARKANKYSRISLFVNGFLLAGTLAALYLTNKSVDISAEAVKEAHTANLKADTARWFNDSVSKANLDLATMMFNAQQESGYFNDSMTKENFSVNSTSMMLGNRAFIIVTDVRLEGLKEDTVFHALIIIKNVGKTPAYKVKTGIDVFFKSSESLVDLKNIKTVTDTSYEAYIGANQQIQPDYINRSGIRKDTLDMLETGKMKLFLAASISYKDAFNKIHYTHSLMEYVFDRKAFAVCRKYNDSN